MNPEPHPWTDEQRALINADPQLSLIGTVGLECLLTSEEQAALQEHLTALAVLRRRVLGEHGQENVG